MMSAKVSATKDHFKREALVHMDSLVRTALYMTGDKTTADNLIQETYLRAYCLWGNLNLPVGYRTRLFRAMTNLLHEYQRSQKLSSINETEALEEELSTEDISVLSIAPDETERLCQKIGEETIKEAIGRLPFDLRLIVILTNIEGFSYQEVAEIAEMEIGAVKTKIARGRQLLQKIILKQMAGKGLVKEISPLN